MKTILGIDPGFGRMGFGCIQFEAGAMHLVSVGVATTVHDIAFGERLLQLESDLRELIETHTPDLIAVEKLYFSKNVKTAMQVAESRGMVMLTAARCNIPVQEFGPTQIKLALTGDGKAEKRAVQEMVKRLLHLPRIPEPDDAADAVAVAITAIGSAPERR